MTQLWGFRRNVEGDLSKTYRIHPLSDCICPYIKNDYARVIYEYHIFDEKLLHFISGTEIFSNFIPATNYPDIVDKSSKCIGYKGPYFLVSQEISLYETKQASARLVGAVFISISFLEKTLHCAGLMRIDLAKQELA